MIFILTIPLTAGCLENHGDTVLDLEMNIDENRFVTKIYHKFDDWFEVDSFLFPTSNMLDHVITHVILSYFLSRNLLESLLNRGFSKYRLKNSFNRFMLNYHDVLDIKYSMTEINLIYPILVSL